MVKFRKRNKSKNNKNQSIIDWAIKFFKKNPVKSLSTIATVFGSCFIAAYHFHIEYRPQYDISSMASTVLDAAFIGVIVLVLYNLIIFFPAVFIGTTIKEDKSLSTYETTLRIVIWFCVAFFDLLAIFVFFMIFSKVKTLVDSAYMIEWLIGSGVFLVGFLIFIIVKSKLVLSVLFKAFVLTILEAWVVVVIFFILLHSSMALDDVIDFNKLLKWVGGADLFIQVGGAAFLIARIYYPLKKNYQFLSALFIFFIPILISMIFENPAFLSCFVANALKIGNYYASEITVDKHGCDVLSEKGINVCGIQVGDSFKVCGAYVMSSIGSQYYLKLNFPGEDSANADKQKLDQQKPNGKTLNNQKLVDVLIPSSDILGLKPAMKVKNFSLMEINKFLSEKPSICPASADVKKKETISMRENELFEFDHYSLTALGKKNLDKLALAINEKYAPDSKIEIIGHADRIGSPLHNMALSDMRALTVESYLTSKFSDNEKFKNISSRGMGSSRPHKTEVDCPDSMDLKQRISCLSENRRVDIGISTI